MNKDNIEEKLEEAHQEHIEVMDMTTKIYTAASNNNTKHLFICLASLIAILFIALASLSIVTIIKVNKLEDKINETKPCTLEGNKAELNELDITTTAYYKNQLIQEESFDVLVEEMDEYLLYFHQSGCSYCAEANYELDKFITSGKGYRNGPLPVLFATPATAKFLFDKYNVESTPEIIYVQGDSITRYNGSKDVIEFLNNISTKIVLDVKGEQQ